MIAYACHEYIYLPSTHTYAIYLLYSIPLQWRPLAVISSLGINAEKEELLRKILLQIGLCIKC